MLMPETENSDETAEAEATAAAPEEPRPPMALKRGSKIQSGYRKGTVKVLRGGGPKPYDFLVRWDGEKYPQWLLYATAERDYERGELEVG